MKPCKDCKTPKACAAKGACGAKKGEGSPADMKADAKQMRMPPRSMRAKVL